MKNQKLSNIVLVSLITVIVLGLSVFCWVKPAGEYSDSERRPLAKFPELSWETVLNTDFMSDFETYTLDQFPLRDGFRAIKVFSELYIFNKSESNDIYIKDGYVAKVEYPMNTPLIENAVDKFEHIIDKYTRKDGVNVYLSIVPDKNYFLAADNGYPSLDYELMENMVAGGLEGKAEYIDIFDLLAIEDYYRTDTHWKQESITHVVDALLAAMDAGKTGEYTENSLEAPFKGVYLGQLGLPLKPDSLVYLTNDVINSCVVTSYDTGKAQAADMYDMEAANGKDAYEIFVCGADALVTIENPNAKTDRELVVFRDSFGSSIAPLLCENYAKVTMVDIRYMMSDNVGFFVDFENCDVLFLYSTLVLNNSAMLK